MKICKICGEPKFNWQMEKHEWTTPFTLTTFKEILKICKKCWDRKIFRLKQMEEKFKD